MAFALSVAVIVKLDEPAVFGVPERLVLRSRNQKPSVILVQWTVAP
jgi:hypothetical protein